MEDFSPFIKQCDDIVWSVEKIQKEKIKRLNERIILLSKCEVCESKKLKIIKEQEATGLLSTLGIKTPLSKILLLDLLLL